MAGEEDQKSVPPATQSAPQLIKKQKGFLKNALAGPSPSGKSKSTSTRPGSSASHRREGSPTVIPPSEDLLAGATKQPEKPTSTEQKLSSPAKPGGRLFTIAMEESARPAEQPSALEPAATNRDQNNEIKEEDNNNIGKRRSRSKSPSHNQNLIKRYKSDDKQRSMSPSRSPYSDHSRSPSPYRSRSRERRRSPDRRTDREFRQLSAEEGEVRDPRNKEKERDRGRDRRYSPSRSRSRSRDRQYRRKTSHRDIKRSKKDRRDDKYRDSRDRDRGKEYRGRSQRSRSRDRSKDRRDRDRRDRDRGRNRRSPSRSRDRARSRSKDQGGGGGARGRVSYEERVRDYIKEDQKKMNEGRGDEYRVNSAGGGGGGLGRGMGDQSGPPVGGVGVGVGGVIGGPHHHQPPVLPMPMTSAYQPVYLPPPVYNGQIPPYPHGGGGGGGAPHLPPPFFLAALPRPPRRAQQPALASQALQPPQPEPQQQQLVDIAEMKWPQDLAAAGPPPPSPDISKYATPMASVHGIEYSPSTGLNLQALLDKIVKAESSFRRKECHIWAAQQAQQEMLLAALDGDIPDPFDAVVERLGLPLSQLSPRASMSPTKAPRPQAALVIVPFDPVDATAPPPDPRREFVAEYQAVKEWARRPLRLPAWKINKRINGGDGDGGGSRGLVAAADDNNEKKPSASWSHSPSREYGEPEVATVKNKAVPQPPQPLGSFAAGSTRRPGSAAGGRFDDVLNAPSAPRHDMSYSRSVPRSMQRIPSHPSVLLTGGNRPGSAELPPLDIDEGYFDITLPDGSRLEQEQYSQLLQLVRQGKVPPGWPVYRPSDGIWAALREATTAMEEFESTRIKEAVGAGVDVPPSLWSQQASLQYPKDSKNKEWFIDQDKEIAKNVAAVAGGSEKVLQSKGYLVAGGQERKVVKQADIGKIHATPHIEADESAMSSIKEAIEKRKLKRKSATLPVTSYAAPAHVVAAVHGGILENKDGFRHVVKGMMQSALRTVIERQQAEAKKKAAATAKVKAEAKS